MTIAGKISLGGSVGLSLATAALAFMVMGTKNRFSQQLIAVESSLRDNKFTSLGLPYTGNFIENEAEPAASVSQAGQKWDVTAADLKSSKSAEESAKKDAEEAKAKAQELRFRIVVCFSLQEMTSKRKQKKTKKQNQNESRERHTVRRSLE